MINGAFLNVVASADAAVQQGVLGDISVGAFAQAFPEVVALEDSIARSEQDLEPRQGSLVQFGMALSSLRRLIEWGGGQNANEIRVGLLRLEHFLERLPENERSRLRTLAARTAIEMDGVYEGMAASVSANLAALKVVEGGIVVFNEEKQKIGVQDRYSRITGTYDSKPTPNLLEGILSMIKPEIDGRTARRLKSQPLTIWDEIRETIKSRMDLPADLIGEAQLFFSKPDLRKDADVVLFTLTLLASILLEYHGSGAALVLGAASLFLGGIANLDLHQKLRGDSVFLRGNKLDGDAAAEEYEDAAQHYEKGGFYYLAAQAYYRAASAWKNRGDYWPLIAGQYSAAGDYFSKRGLFAKAALAYLEGAQFLDGVQDEAAPSRRISFRNSFLTGAAEALEKAKERDPNSILARTIDPDWLRELRWRSLDHLESVPPKDVHSTIATNEMSLADDRGRNGLIEDAAMLYLDASDHWKQAGEKEKAQKAREGAKRLATMAL